MILRHCNQGTQVPAVRVLPASEHSTALLLAESLLPVPATTWTPWHHGHVVLCQGCGQLGSAPSVERQPCRTPQPTLAHCGHAMRWQMKHEGGRGFPSLLGCWGQHVAEATSAGGEGNTGQAGSLQSQWVHRCCPTVASTCASRAQLRAWGTQAGCRRMPCSAQSCCTEPLPPAAHSHAGHGMHFLSPPAFPCTAQPRSCC